MRAMCWCSIWARARVTDAAPRRHVPDSMKDDARLIRGPAFRPNFSSPVHAARASIPYCLVGDVRWP